MKAFVCLALFSFVICTVFAAPNGSKDLNLSSKLKETEGSSSRYGSSSFASPQQGFGNTFGSPNQIPQGPGYGPPRPPSNAFGSSPQFDQFFRPSPQFGQSFPPSPQFGQSFPPPPQFGQSFPPSPQFGQSFPPSPQFGQSFPPPPQFGQSFPPSPQFGPFYPPSFGNSFPSFGSVPPPYYGFPPQNPWYSPPGFGVQPFRPSFPYYPHHAHQDPYSSSPRPGPYYYNGFGSIGSTPRPSYYYNSYGRMLDDTLPIPEDVLSEEEESNSDFDPDSAPSLVFV